MRILIIEDDKNLCQIMRAGLQDAGIDSDFCHDGETGLELLLHNCYDACCLDRMLPSMDGLTILKKARAAKVSAPVLMLTAMGGLDDKVDGLEAGADDYLAKPFAMRELVARLHALLRRPSQAMAVEESNQIHYEDATLDCNQLELCGPKGHCQLSKKEADLLEVFFRYPHQLFTRERLLSRVWGDDTEIEESNLNTYIHFVRKKLKKAGICLTITTIRGVGYRLENIHAIQGYKLGILRYIMKEQLEHELPHCMDAVLARYFKHRDVLEMKFVEGKYCVYQDEIVYMESQGHKVNFHLSLGMSVRILTAHTTIDAMQLQLNQNRFVRPHKSFLVNCSYIDKIECGNILLQSGDRITISQSRKKDVDALLTAIL